MFVSFEAINMLLYNFSSSLIWLAESSDLNISSISIYICVCLMQIPTAVLQNTCVWQTLACPDTITVINLACAALIMTTVSDYHLSERRSQVEIPADTCTIAGDWKHSHLTREFAGTPCIMHAVSRLFILENGDVSCVSITVLYYSSKQMQIVLGMMKNCCLPSANIDMRQWFQLVITLHISLFYFPNTKILQHFLVISKIYNT